MKTLFMSHRLCEQHEMGAGHPESPARLRAIHKMVEGEDWCGALQPMQAPLLDASDLTGVHPRHHVAAILERKPEEGLIYLDGDTAIIGADGDDDAGLQ